jgi:hypothetical protein
MNQTGERYCAACSLDLRKLPALEKESSISTRAVVIVWLIVIAGGLLWWLFAAMGASGLSDR